MLGLASKSGNMAEIYDSTAKFLERQADFKKNLKSALISPIVTLDRSLRRRHLLRRVHLPRHRQAVREVQDGSAADDQGDAGRSAIFSWTI
jgi:type II secretory pathway component PulF